MTEFNPDEFLAQNGSPPQGGFDPDAFLSANTAPEKEKIGILASIGKQLASLSGISDEDIAAGNFDPFDVIKAVVANNTVGQAEALRSIGSTMVAEPVSGLVGIGAAGANLVPGVDVGNPGDVVEKTQAALTYTPKTKAGQRNLQAVGTVMEPVGTALEKSSEFLGDKTLEATGSPAAAAAAATIPTAALEALGIGVGKGLTKIKAAKAKPATEEINITQLPEDPQLIDSIEAQAPRTQPGRPGQPPSIEEINISELPKQERIRHALQTGGRDAAGYKLKGDRVVKDSVQLKAMDQGFDPSTVAGAHSMNPAERTIARRILNKAERYLNNRAQGIGDHPSAELGKPLVDRFNVVLRVNRKARLDQKKAIADLRGKTIAVDDVVTDFTNTLDDLGFETLITKDGPKLKATNAALKGNRDVKHLQVINDFMQQKPTGRKMQELKDYLDEQIDWSANPMNQSKVTGSVLKLMKDVRRGINQKLRDASPEYAAANDTLSESIQVMNDFGDTMRKRFDIEADNVADYVGKQMRKVATNYGIGEDMITSIKNLDALAAKYGRVFNDDPVKLAQYYSDLEKRFGSFKSNSFQGGIEKGINFAQIAGNVAAGNIGSAALDTAKTGAGMVGRRSAARRAAMQKMKTDREAFSAMRNLLRSE